METCTCKPCPVHMPRVNLNAAAACAPFLGGAVVQYVTVNGQQWQPVPKFPPPSNAAACAGNPTAYLWHQS